MDLLVLLVPSELLETTVSLGPKDNLEHLALLVLTGLQALREHKARREVLDPLGPRVVQDLQDSKGRRVLRDPRASQGLLVHQDLLEIRATRELRVL